MLQFFLRQHMQDIRLVLGGIHCLEQPDASIFGTQGARIMPGRHVLRPQRQRMIQQELPADRTVAGQAGVGCASGSVTIQEILHHDLDEKHSLRPPRKRECPAAPPRAAPVPWNRGCSSDSKSSRPGSDHRRSIMPVTS